MTTKKSKQFRKTRSKRQRGAADPTPAMLAARAAALEPWNREIERQIENLRMQMQEFEQQEVSNRPSSPTSTATTNFEGGKRKTRKAKKSRRSKKSKRKTRKYKNKKN
jgi:hypothetical protein